ncbi:MAG TPA: ROK family protein [Candidatus Limnocylindrales bacterium]|nr:ROK family protein [Candidatus Limnocylindrales bacterium]
MMASRDAEPNEPIVGVNVGGTMTSVVLGTRDGAILGRRAWPTQTRDGEALFAAIVAAVREIAPDASAIGVAIGGPMDALTGTVLSPPHLPGMHGFPLAARLREALEREVHVHHDAAACALAEYLWGAHRGARGIAYLTCGTGFGAGLVIGGHARYGSRGYSPELGHIRYRDHGPDVFGKPGSFESFGAASALPKIARLENPAYDAASGAEVAERAARGDALAQRAIGENARAVGAACALLADLLVLDVIVLGSLAAYLGEPWIALVRETFVREALPHHAAACTLCGPSLADLQDLSGLAAAVSPL